MVHDGPKINENLRKGLIDVTCEGLLGTTLEVKTVEVT